MSYRNYLRTLPEPFILGNLQVANHIFFIFSRTPQAWIRQNIANAKHKPDLMPTVNDMPLKWVCWYIVSVYLISLIWSQWETYLQGLHERWLVSSVVCKRTPSHLARFSHEETYILIVLAMVERSGDWRDEEISFDKFCFKYWQTPRR